jgi:hypothetical protein
MNLTFGAADHRFDLPGMEVAVSAKDFDLSIIDAFVDQLDDMRGSLSSTVMCTGSLNHPLFNGTVDLRSGEFLFAMNAMTYRSDCSVVFHDSVLTLTGATIKNLDDDYANGKVDLTGSILFQGFLPTEYHLGLMGTLMVMSKTVRVPDQSYYGNLVVATGPEGLHFDGGYVKSLITGNLLLKESMLTFPPTRQTASLLSSRFLKIAVVDDTSKPAVVDSMASSLLVEFVGAKAQQAVDESSFLDGLIYDLGIQTDGVIQIRMVFNQATNEELFADLKGRLRLAKTGDAVNLTGSIDVSERSSYTFYKKFDAQGSLTFTGKPDNPQLDIAATYQSTHLKAQTDTTQAPVSEKVYVTLTIGGTRYEPKVKLGLTVKDESGVEIERTGDVEGDAISFLLTSSPGSPGKFRDDLTSNDKQSIATQLGGPIGAALVSGYANTLLSGIMLDFLRANNITFVSNAEVRYVGASPDLRLSGELLNAYWSFGGRVFNDINNANISLQMPLGAIVGNEELKNFMVELERRTEPVETVDTRRASVTGARIYYRIIF